MDIPKCELYYDGQTLYAVPGGGIDHHTARPIRELIDEAVTDRRASRLVLDLSGVDFMDSAGLGLILGRLRHISSSGGKLVLLDPTSDIMRILRLAGLDKRLAIVDGGSERTHLSALRTAPKAAGDSSAESKQKKSS